MASSIWHPPKNNTKKNFPFVGLLVPLEKNWLKTKFSVLNFGKQSLNIIILCKNFLSDRFNSYENLSFADMETCWMSWMKINFKPLRPRKYSAIDSKGPREHHFAGESSQRCQ